MLETGQKDEKEDSFALMIKTPKETYVLIAFQKSTAIWDIKMGDVPLYCRECMYVFFRLECVGKVSGCHAEQTHTSTPTTTTFRPRKRKSTTLRVSDHTTNAFPSLYSTNKTVTL